ncbi:MAG: hypothetical protein GF404_07375 [candidate division Zixibacteria bacterium]|nr:hypothetical protein [candidate division Zixibacteria bacterium]
MSKFSDDFEKYLNLYLDNELPDSERREFENYLAENPDKAEELALYQKLDSEAREIEVPERAEGYWEGLAGRIDSQVERLESGGTPQKSESPFKNLVFSFHNWMKLAAGALMIVTVFLISRHLSDDFSLMDVMDDKLLEKQKSLTVDSPETSPAKNIDSQFQDLDKTRPGDEIIDIRGGGSGEDRYEIDGVTADSQIGNYVDKATEIATTDTIDRQTEVEDQIEASKKHSEVVLSESETVKPKSQQKQDSEEEVVTASRDKTDLPETASLRQSTVVPESLRESSEKIEPSVPARADDLGLQLKENADSKHVDEDVRDKSFDSVQQDEVSLSSHSADSVFSDDLHKLMPESVEPMGRKFKSSQPVRLEDSLDSLIEAYADAVSDNEKQRVLRQAIQTGLLSIKNNHDPKMIRKVEELIEEALKTELLEPKLIEQYERDLLRIKKTKSQP